MLMRFLVSGLWLQTAAQPSKDADILTKLFVLVVAALHANFQSTFFWFCVAGAFISWWISWIVRDAVRNAIEGLDLEGTVRDAVRDALEEDREDRRDVEI
jgi:hypothetical protein